MRGRVMALWAIAFQGTTPIGGPLIGLVVAGAGARAGLLSGAVSCVAAAAVAAVFMRKLRERTATASGAGDLADGADAELPVVDLD
jgi:MFS family permease